jgi:hypothetical protein
MAVVAAVVAAGIATGVATTVWAADDGLDLTGEVRLRLRNVASPDTGDLLGTYGETLLEGFSLKHRLVLEASYPLGADVRAGGMLRISNEGKDVLLAGPDYLSSEYGSAFIAYETPTVRSRLGYYPTSYSPLTLMRWDTKDDPEGGGGSSCGCPGAPAVAGSILGETLEELGPTLTFEGLRVSVTPTETFSADGFFARPRVADEDYQLITYGGRLGVTRYSARTSGFFDLGLVALRTEEEEGSLTGSEAAAAGEPFENAVYGLVWKAPVLKLLSLDGEWTLTESSGEVDKKGRGGIVSLALKPSKSLLVETSYLYLSPNWESYFHALSYNPDRQGVRVRAELTRGNLVIAAFARYLATVDPVAEADDKKVAYPTLSLRGYLKAARGVNLALGAILAGSGPEEDGLTLDVDTRRLSVIGTVTYEFAEDSAVTLEERYVHNTVGDADPAEGAYDVSTLSLYVKAAMW